MDGNQASALTCVSGVDMIGLCPAKLNILPLQNFLSIALLPCQPLDVSVSAENEAQNLKLT